MVDKKMYDEVLHVTEAFFSSLDCSVCGNNGREDVCRYCSNHGEHGYLLYCVNGVHSHAFVEEVLRIVRECEETIN